ncbi:MAG TPA: trehalase-like domain-containing protein, partial [Blastocatellia bacterium]|nr:trehalase-like domain-containing protein [Blastocatellia bacterium]
MNPHFRQVIYIDNYLPLEDHGLIGDGRTAALVGRDGAISWLCLPRFDSPPIFCKLLDHRRGGAFTVAPEDLLESRQYYLDRSAVLVTEMRSRTGLVRVTDALTLRRGADLSENVAAARDELVRHIEVLEGQVKLRVELDLRGGFDMEGVSGGLALRPYILPNLDLHLTSSTEVTHPRTLITLKAGERLNLILRWGVSTLRHQPFTPEEVLRSTSDVWQRWAERINYDGPQASLVHRSAITLKMLDYFENGAVVAAPTSSLPELIGGERNWDYR